MELQVSQKTDLRPEPATPEKVAVVLVVPAGSIHPKSGGGQRTGILFEALKKIGDVVVVILSEEPAEGAEEFFVGAKRVISFTKTAMTSPSENRLIREFAAVMRFLRPAQTFKAADGLAEVILGELDQMSHSESTTGLRLVAARYARSFATTGLISQPEKGFLTCVDVDDRDDQKIDLQVRRRLGNLLGSLARVAWRPRFLHNLQITLSRASVLFLAKPQDHFDMHGPRQVVMPNVPFVAPDAASVQRADATNETLLFVGSAGHRPNQFGVIWFLRFCWPAIRAERPTATVRVVGLGDWSSLPSDLITQPGVELVGAVDDLASEYAQARAAICPILEGAGSQIKVIEACAYSRPVVSTAFASGGFGPDIERNLSVASDADSFARACTDLLSDPARAARQGAALRDLQQATHSRETVENLIFTTLTDVIASANMQQRLSS